MLTKQGNVEVWFEPQSQSRTASFIPFDRFVNYTEEFREEENGGSQQRMEHRCARPAMSV